MRDGQDLCRIPFKYSAQALNDDIKRHPELYTNVRKGLRETEGGYIQQVWILDAKGGRNFTPTMSMLDSGNELSHSLITTALAEKIHAKRFGSGYSINGLDGTTSRSQAMALVVFLGNGPDLHAYEAVCHVVENIAGDKYGLNLNRKWMLEQHPDKTPPCLPLYGDEDNSKLTKGMSI